jgi:hypothetical protein
MQQFPRAKMIQGLDTRTDPIRPGWIMFSEKLWISVRTSLIAVRRKLFSKINNFGYCSCWVNKVTIMKEI